jgi:hypothetical protein
MECWRSTLITQQTFLDTSKCPQCGGTLDEIQQCTSMYKMKSSTAPEPVLAHCPSCSHSFSSSFLNQTALNAVRSLPSSHISYLDRSNSVLPLANPYDGNQSSAVKAALSEILINRQTHAYNHFSSCMKPSKRTHGFKVNSTHTYHKFQTIFFLINSIDMQVPLSKTSV